MLPIELELQKNYSNRKIGSIARCLEVLTIPMTVDWTMSRFDEDDDIDALPVEESGIIIGILEREIFIKNSTKWVGEIRLKEVKNVLSKKPLEVNAEDYIENVFDKIMLEDRSNIPEYFLVYANCSYLGFVSFLQIVRQINALRIMDLDKAKEVQKNLLDKAKIKDPRLEFGVYNKMAGRVGGDFYLNFPYNGGRNSLIGCFDVSGKGFAASMSTNIVGSFFSGLKLHGIDDRDPMYISRTLDAYVKELSPEGTFIAAVLMFVNYDLGKFYIQNYGLTPVFIFDPVDGKSNLKILKPNQPPLGLGDLASIKQTFAQVEIKKGMRIVMLTDGLPELRDPYGNQFGDEAVRQVILNSINHTQDDFINTIAGVVEKFRDKAPQADDVTVVDIRF